MTPAEEMVESLELGHREELAKMEMQLALYRSVLEQHGIDPPNEEGRELLKLWRDSAAVITTASEFVAGLGSAKELVSKRLGAPL